MKPFFLTGLGLPGLALAVCTYAADLSAAGRPVATFDQVKEFAEVPEAPPESDEPIRAGEQTAELPEPAPSVPSLFLQGEYAGPIHMFRTPDGCIHDYAALQVVDEGHGGFSAVFYAGGLPGSGWSRTWKTRLMGERHGDQIRLSGNGLRATVGLARAVVEMDDGRTVGFLQRMLRHSATEGKAAPYGAIVLFDGSSTQHFRNGSINSEGHLRAGAELKDMFRDYVLHVEFRLPNQPNDRSQGRGNSGIYLQSRYEVQILDSFGLEGAFNECGALYRLRAPDVNMCLPPSRWQTYDISFRSPRFDAQGQKVQNARITVLHNNVVIHDNVEIPRKTGAGQAEGLELLPIKLQDHGDPVEFRNIWIVDYSSTGACRCATNRGL